jgi:Ser/Thr protein kinase RdoA (MazF antagonist)
VLLVFDEVRGAHPAVPWRDEELQRVLDGLADLATELTPSPLGPDEVRSASDLVRSHIAGWQQLRDDPELHAGLDDWSRRHLEALAELESDAPEAVAGETLLHFDVRADNVLLDGQRVWFFDWPHACRGAAWFDVVAFAPSVRMQGGPPGEEVLARYGASRTADPDAVTAAVATVAGYFTRGALLPPPPGLPTLRAFQAAQGAAAREWLAQRTGCWVDCRFVI